MAVARGIGASVLRDDTAQRRSRRIIDGSPVSPGCGQIRSVNSYPRLARRVPFLIHALSKGKTTAWQGLAEQGRDAAIHAGHSHC